MTPSSQSEGQSGAGSVILFRYNMGPHGDNWVRGKEADAAIATRGQRIAELEQRIRELEPAAECWDAICACYRITCMGSAGVVTKHATGYAHITLNFWTTGEPRPDTAADVQGAQDLQGRTMLADFMMIAVKNYAALAQHRTEQKEGE